MTSNAERRPRSNCAAGTAMPPNFVLLDAVLPDVARLVTAMVQARDAVERRSWSHPQEPTSEEWWADVLADPRARKLERRRTDLPSSKRFGPTFVMMPRLSAVRSVGTGMPARRIGSAKLRASERLSWSRLLMLACLSRFAPGLGAQTMIEPGPQRRQRPRTGLAVAWVRDR